MKKLLLLFLLFTSFKFSLFGNECATATAANCNDVVTGSTVGGTPSGLSDCVTSASTGGADWYVITGDGTTWTAETVVPSAGGQYDTKIWVFSGSCGSLSCVTGDDDGGSGTLSKVTFATTIGTTYYIIVGGYGSAEGNYEMTIQSGGACECSSAQVVDCNDVVMGNTASGIPSSLPTCVTTAGAGGAKWYTLTGDGTTWTAETVVPSAGGQYDTKIWVFSGSCSSLSCVTGDDDGGSGTLSKVTFATTIGTTYYIIVGGYGSATGTYEMTIQGGACECSSADVVSCGTVVTASTAGGVPSGLPTCVTTAGTGGAKWYTFTGDGNTWRAETVPVSGQYDTKLWVFSGTCGALTCVTGNDDGGAGTLSKVSFATTSGTTYYIIVGGFSANEGTFELHVESTCECDYAEPVSCNTTVSGTTTGGTSSGLPFCVTSAGTGGANWYTLTGDGQQWTAETVPPSAGGQYDTKLWVFSGTCGALTCVTGDDDGGAGTLSKVVFTSSVGTTYYIIVGGFGSNEGNYQMDITCAVLPVELVAFTAAARDKEVALDWETATEINNDYFTVERSKDALHWEKVLEMPGMGTSYATQVYQALDKSPYEGASYYRLKQTDYDGSFTYSEVKKVHLDIEGSNEVFVYPNPAGDRVTVEGRHGAFKTWQLYNLQGVEVRSSIKIIEQSDARLYLDLSALETGVYLLQTPYTAVKIYKQ